MVYLNSINKFVKQNNFDFVLKFFLLSFLFIIFSQNLFAKPGNKGNSSTQNISEKQVNTDNQSKNSFDENSTDYFDSFNSENTNNSSGSYNNRNNRQPSTVWMFIRMILVLVFVCVLIYLVFWLLKRKSNIATTDNEYLRRAAYINIGTNKSIEVITLIDKAYLIGVTEDNITLLGEIDDKELIQAMNITADKKQNVKNPVNFNEVLDLFTKKSNKNGNAFEQSESSINEILENGSSDQK